MKENKNKRKSISKKLRFEVFKRDKFKCVYCGSSAPDVVLQVDHIDPVSNGGDNNILNLATSCFDCNSGKSNRKLDDQTVLKQQKDQLDELQERMEQIEMMVEWQKGLKNIKDRIVYDLKEFWEELAPGYSITETGLKQIKKLTREYEYKEIREAMEISSNQYLNFIEESVTEESWDKAFSKIGGIIRVRRDSNQNPDLKELFYIRGILKNRVRYFNSSLAITLLKIAHEKGISIEKLKKIALQVDYMDDFEDEINELIEE
ncbi:MAG: HNH endonuclease [Saprospiraceae bacterium]|nr:HNH endonuclease [Saprospiraceae bacterium]